MQVRDLIEYLKRFDPNAQVKILIWMGSATGAERDADSVRLDAGKVVIESK